MEKENSRNQIILDLSSALRVNDIGPLKNVITENLHALARVFSADRAIIFLTDSDSLSYSLQYEWFQSKELSLKTVLNKLHFRDYMIWGKFKPNVTCLQINNTYNIPDSYPFDSKLFRDTNCSAYIQKSLLSQKQQIGFIALLKNETTGPWDMELVNFLETAGELIKTLILRIRELSEVSEKDKDQSFTQSYQALHIKQKESIAFFERVFSNLHYGIAIYDTGFQRFVFSNARCSELFGLERNVNLHAKDIFKVFRNNGYNTRDFFSPEEQSQVKDFTLIHNKMYLNGSVSPVKETAWVVMSVNDITPIANYEKSEKSFNHQLKIIGEAAIDLISPENEKEDMFQFIGETANLLIDNAVIMVNKYFEKEGYLKTVMVKGIGSSMETIGKLMGKHPLHKTYPLDINSEHYKVMVSKRITEVEGGIPVLSLGTVSEPVARRIQKILNVNRFFTCGLYAGGTLYGTLIFMVRPESDINFYILETYARMASNALHAFDMEQKLNKTSRALTDSASIAKIGYWEYDFYSRCFMINNNLYKKLDPEFNPITKDDDVALQLDVFLSKFVSDDDALRIKKTLDKAAQNKQKENYVIDLEFRVITSAGKSIYVYTRGIMHNTGKLLGVAQDISEIKKVEKNLWESELKFQNLVEQSQDAIVVIKDDGIITEWNPSAEDVTGMTAEQVLGRFAWEIESAIIYNPSVNKKHPQQPESKLRNRFFRFFQSNVSKEPVNTEITIRNPKGEIKYLSITSFVFSANQSRFLCRISKDITLEKQKQEREKQQEIHTKTAQAKDLFLDNMSHEMRTPLSGIIGMTDILLHTRLSPQQNEMMKVVKESSDSLLELITSIHELSRLEIDGVIIQKKPFRMNVLMERTLSIFKASALQKSIELVLHDNTPANLMIKGDEFRLRQVIGNLMGNAIKFTPPGGKVEAIVNSQRTTTGQMQFKIEIKDTGIGIEEDKIPILFEKFTQVDNSYTREYEGVGIGLSISKELIKLMGGEIGVNSQHRQGSVFWIKISLTYSEE